jgi:hypothetical protein
MGSTPTPRTIGKSNGVSMRIAAGGSRKLPANSSPTLRMSSNSQRGMCVALIDATICCGMPLVVKSHE